MTPFLGVRRLASNEARWPSAIKCRDKFNTILKGASGGLDEFFNGVMLEMAEHAKLTCQQYYDNVWQRIDNRNTALELINELFRIPDELAADVGAFLK